MKGKLKDSYDNHYDMDIDEMEKPQYLESIDQELEEDQPQTGAVQNYIDELWVSQPQLIEESLEKLEAEDNEYRSRLSQISEKDKSQADQLLLQKQLYVELIDFSLKLHRISSFSSVKGYRKTLRTILKSLLNFQYKLSSQKIKPKKLSRIDDNSEIIWDWMAELAREWSTRVNLKIGGDIIDQTLKESEKLTEFDIQAFLARETRTNDVPVHKQTVKKPHHHSSKHRKLKFDIHEKLQNFMTPIATNFEPRHNTLIKTLFGRREEGKTEKVYLDVPLI
ncbi:unnamed protein product [Blepharisma stoltei]|uniref:Apoptosis-antagonizing transcription factor C-terminal domain-containing protein n=1 Tax=Blepharisma stoltei TaxID=1481888 RepID=A0AAU9IUW3_9CILI|nr:unnamed protein product [Blepharisma stoltei]